jgi:hypothetical protein
MMGHFTGKPNQFDGNFTMVSGEDFPLNQSNDLCFVFFFSLGVE